MREREREREREITGLRVDILSLRIGREKRSTAEIKKKKKIFIRRFRDLGFVGFRDLRFVKFQFSIISLVNFCNYLLFFLNFKYMLDIKGI